MYNVSDAVKNEYKSPVQLHFVRGYIGNVAFSNANIIRGTLVWDNQCAHDDTMIGTVYVGRLQGTFVGLNIPRGTWQGLKVTVEMGISMGLTVEWVPCGEWFISEVAHTQDGTRITAYDALLKLDTPLQVRTTQGKAYDFINLALANTGVLLDMTENQVDALPNATQILTLDSEHNLETNRDLLSAVAQCTGTYATINRSGKLELRRWQTTPVDTISNTHRLEGAEFSDFATYYSGVSCVVKADNSTHYYGDLVDDSGLTVNLGTNPFLQGLAAPRLELIMRNILAELEKIHYVPFGTDIIDNPLYDLGDVINCTDGIADTSKCCVMSYEVTFGSQTALDGFGSDPALHNVKSKTDKDIAGLMAETKADEIQYYTFTNAEDYTIGNNQEKTVISITFLTLSSAHVTFQAEILLEADCQDTLECEVKYRKNGVLQEYKPKELWIDGKHILSLFYPMEVEPNTAYMLEVLLNSSGGSITVPERSIQAMIWGQGLVASGSWDGNIGVRDNVPKFPIKKNMDVRAFDATPTAAQITPTASSITGNAPKFGIKKNMGIRAFGDYVMVNKRPARLEETWGSISSYTWAEAEDEFYWG